MKLALLSVFLALPILAQTSQPVKFVSSDPSGACSNGTAMRYNFVNGNFWGCKALVWTPVSGGSGGSPISGATVNAIVTAASATTIQTAAPTATMDSSGNISTPGTATFGAGSVAPGVMTPAPTTVSGLPTCAAPTTNARAGVTDATASTFYSVVVGGGGLKVPVFCDGLNWRVG